MDTAILVRTEREAAWKLLEALEKEPFPMTAAFWQYVSDAETWRLVIATPLVDEIGYIAAYTRIQTLLNQLPEEISEGFSVTNITLLSPTAERLVKLRNHYGIIPKNRSHIRRISLSPEEGYIYFLE